MKFCQICRESYYPDDSFCPQCHGGGDTEDAPLMIIQLVDKDDIDNRMGDFMKDMMGGKL